MAENEINTVHVLIRRFLYEIDDVIKDKDASHKWLVSFAKTLQFQDLCKTPNEYALTLLREAKEFCLSQRKKSQIKQVRKILADEGNASPTKEQIETRWAELYGNDTTADVSTREDSQAKHDGSAITRNENRAHDALGTSANIYGDAATREGAEFCTNRESGASEPTTISKNIGNDQGTEALVSQRRAGADSVRGTPLHSAPARSRASFRNKEEYMQWAIDKGLDPDDAGNCWEATMERGGLTKDGKKVENLCAYAVKWCRTRKKNRETA